MKRFFQTDSESDALIATATKCYGLKNGELFNMAIKNEFLPVTEPYRTEGAYLLQQHAANKDDDWTIKQSMSRGIRALGTHPVYNSSSLQGFFTRYDWHTAKCAISDDDSLWEPATKIYDALNKQYPLDYDGNIIGGYLVDNIFSNWQALWCMEATYDVLAAIAYRCDPNRPFSWFEGITFLQDIEQESLGQWSNVPSRSK